MSNQIDKLFIDKLGKTKDPKSFSHSIKNAINTVSFDSKKIVPFGSWTYRSQLYPSDIDLIEVVVNCCNKKDATNKFVKEFQNLVKSIIRTPGVFLGDIKAGVDEVFEIDIGKIIFNNKGQYQIIGYNPTKIRKEIDHLFKMKYINITKYKRLMSLVPNDIDQRTFEQLETELYDSWIIRWSADEILKGYKILSPKRIFTLDLAVNQPTMTKIDTWRQINGRFTEVSNIFMLYMKNKNNYKTILNFIPSNSKYDLTENMKKDIQDLLFSTDNFKPFKAIKRMWSIARLENNKIDLDKLTPIMQTDLGRLQQVSSELKVMVDILKNVKKPPLQHIRDQLDTIKYRLQNIYEMNIKSKMILNIYDQLQNEKLNTSQMIYIIEDIIDYYQIKINKYSIDALKQVKLWPIPKNYLPKNPHNIFK